MSNNAANIQAAAAVATAIANQLAAAPAAPMTAGTVADVLGAVLQAAGPAVAGPQVGLVLALASIGLKAMHTATDTGVGLEPWAALLARDDAAVAADAAAHPQA